MWIRSQNKKYLGDYKYIFVMQNEIHGECSLDVDLLGTYKNSDRAIEILDEIQNELCLIHTSDIYKDESPDGIYDYSIVYQMPQN